MIIFATLLLIALAQDIVLPSTDPNFKPLEDQFLMFPMTQKDFSNWNSHGTAVFLKDKLVLTPGIENMKGLVHTTKSMPREAMNGWETHVDLDIGSNFDQQMGSGGFALYYLRNVEISARN